MNTIYLTDQQLAWLAQVFDDATVEQKIDMDPRAHLEQQLADLGAFDLDTA
jgi:hypothetical protein